MEQGVQGSLDVMFPLRMNWKVLYDVLTISNKISIIAHVLGDQFRH